MSRALTNQTQRKKYNMYVITLGCSFMASSRSKLFFLFGLFFPYEGAHTHTFRNEMTQYIQWEILNFRWLIVVSFFSILVLRIHLFACTLYLQQDRRTRQKGQRGNYVLLLWVFFDTDTNQATNDNVIVIVCELFM